jgi:hypothetical protein
MPSTYGPLRPPNERDTIHLLNGSPVYLGALVGGAGVAVNNSTTALPFNAVANSSSSLAGTLAGKVLLLQPLAAGLILASSSNSVVGVVGAPSIALQTVIPPVQGFAPGISLASGSTQLVIMRPDQGWLQWLSPTGGNLLVWEMT